jgi:hypothetical protein
VEVGKHRVGSSRRGVGELGRDFEGPWHAVEVVGSEFNPVDARWEGKSCGEHIEREALQKLTVASGSGWRTWRRVLEFLPLIHGRRISMGIEIFKVAAHLSHTTQ